MKKFLSALAFVLTLTVSAQESEQVYPPVFEGCEQMIDFKDCESCFFRHLMTSVMQELKWPEDLAAEGKVVVEVVYNASSELEKVEVKQSFSPLATREVERVLAAIDLPLRPALQGDKAVNVSYMLPVSFKR